MTSEHLTGRFAQRMGGRQESYPSYPSDPPEIRKVNGIPSKLLRDANNSPIPDSYNPGQYAYVTITVEEYTELENASTAKLEILNTADPSVAQYDALITETKSNLIEAEKVVADLKGDLNELSERKDAKILKDKEAEDTARMEAEQSKLREEEIQRIESFRRYVEQRRQGQASTGMPIVDVQNQPINEVTPRPSNANRFRGLSSRRVLGIVAGMSLITGSAIGLTEQSENTSNTDNIAEDAKATEITAAALDVTNCFDENGEGEPLFSGDISAMEWMKLSFKRTDNKSQDAVFPNDSLPFTPVDENLNPKLPVEATDTKDGVNLIRPPMIEVSSPINYSVCVPEEDKSDFLKLDDSVVKVDLDLADAEFAFPKLEPGLESERTEMQAVEGVISQEEVDRVNATITDQERLLTVAEMVKAEAANLIANDKAVVTKWEGEELQKQPVKTQDLLEIYRSELEAAITEKASSIAAESGQDSDPITVEFVGSMEEQLEYKGPAAPTSDELSLADEQIRITKFDPNTK